MNIKNIMATSSLVLAALASNAADTFSGKVLEATNVSSYTYIQVDTGKAKVWAAAPTMKVKPGDSVVVSNSMAVAGYHSRALDRDFNSVYFTDKVFVNGAPAQPAEAPAVAKSDKPLPAGHPAINKAPTVNLTGIKKADHGITIEELFATKDSLKGKTVIIRGKVTKYNGKILGKNWIHVKDGTGSAGNNDLMVTSAASAKVGDTVLVSGKVTTNRDFGSGYKWPVMIENAEVTVE
jgi:hypothetical protein